MGAGYAGSAPAASASTFTPNAPTSAAFNAGLQGAGVGFLVSSVQNSLQKHNKGAMGVFTRTGGTIGVFAAAAATFTYVDQTLANLRETNDALNGASGGCAAGFLMGVRQGNLPAAFGGCLAVGALIGTFDAAGGSFSGDGRQQLSTEEREAKRREFFKKRPLADQVLQAEAVQSE